MSLSESTIIFRRSTRELSRQHLRAYAAQLSTGLAAGRPFCCMIADDTELRRLNLEFLAKDYATDVLSFPSGDSTGPLGDIAISLDRAREQAGDFGHSIEDEIKILMLHGVLHLLGMDHEKDRGTMRRAENSWRRKLGLPTGLIERTQC